jgi:ribosomal protein S12 methylthiotransferase
LLANAGYSAAAKPSKAGVLIVNTCGFIKPAIDESIQNLRDLARKKRPGQLLIAAGCLTQRFSQMVAEKVPGIDGIIGTRRWMDIVDLIQKLRAERHPDRCITCLNRPLLEKTNMAWLALQFRGAAATSKLRMAAGDRVLSARFPSLKALPSVDRRCQFSKKRARCIIWV